MKIEIIPFSKEILAEAGALLATRHKIYRETFPDLPARFEDVKLSIKALETLLKQKNMGGYAAFRNGKMLAYLLGETNAEPWGRCGWIRLPGAALAEGESYALLQDLYVRLGEDWVQRGVFIHHIYVSRADPALVDAFFSLDFGKERIDAMLDMKQLALPKLRAPEGIHIRRAGKGDNEHLANMSHIIFRQLEKAPYWHPTPPEVWDELKEGWAELADDDSVAAWIAFEGKQAVGTIAAWATINPDDDGATNMFAAENVAYLSVAAVHPEKRKSGIGAALTHACLSHIKEEGFEYCYTNWISPNLSASRFWTRFGFEERAYRLTRNINPMISWTRK